ncbi:glycine betaine ABC transporter substrate-binding protein [Nocardia australiensis]|uniref:glycine betaine ABC transporter substrate-binding protein n=1 Tax=Nocardia australiensis TaxID=2887191 RepID=UPI001D14DCC8|nr:glycine betaine ABC transporter substrate-binding protein [Nocardia australiensis]
MLLAASRRILARTMVVAAVGLAVSCGNDDSGPIISVGAGDSVESNLLAHIYSGALSHTGARTSVTANLGDRGNYLAALDAGTVTVVGEHTGELLEFLDANSSARKSEVAAEVVNSSALAQLSVTDAVNRSLPEGLAVSDPADGTDLRPRLLLDEVTAQRDGVRSIGDLAPRCGGLEAGVAPVPGVLRAPATPEPVAGCAFAVTRPYPDAGALRKALLDGEIQAGILTGPPALVPGATDGLTILSDNDYAVRAENVLSVYRKGQLDDRQIRKLNYVAGELTTDDLADMIRRIRDGAAAADVARDWLDTHAL